MRRALAMSLIALGSCGPRARPAPKPSRPTSTLDWLPADLVTALRAPATDAPMIALIARSPRRPPCVDAAIAGVRETLQLQRARDERMALVLVGALDRDRLEACGIETARAMFGLEVSARRDGALTIFTRASSPAGSPDARSGFTRASSPATMVAGFAADRAVLDDTAEQVRGILHPRRTIGPADPLAPLLPRLAPGQLAAITTIDYLAPWTKLPARATSLRLERQPALRAETRVRYGDPAEARRARDALVRTRGRDDVPFAIRQALQLLEPAVDGAELVLDLAPLFAPAHAALLQNVMRDLASP